jgi:hypothetical protein
MGTGLSPRCLILPGSEYDYSSPSSCRGQESYMPTTPHVRVFWFMLGNVSPHFLCWVFLCWFRAWEVHRLWPPDPITLARDRANTEEFGSVIGFIVHSYSAWLHFTHKDLCSQSLSSLRCLVAASNSEISSAVWLTSSQADGHLTPTSLTDC